MIKHLLLFCIVLALLSALFVGGACFFDRQFTIRNGPEIIGRPVIASNSSIIEPSMVNQTFTFTVGMYNGGYLYQEETDEGIDNDIIKELSRRMNINFVKQVMPRARIHSMLEEGSLPMTVSLIETPERAKTAYFIPYFIQKNYALVSNDLGISTEEELLNRPDVKVGIIRSYYYGEHYSELIARLREKRMIVEAIDTEKLYEMLGDGWIKVAFNIPASYLYYFDAYEIKNVTIMDWAPDEKPLERCISISKKFFSKLEVERFKSAIGSMKEDGTLFKIFSKYLPPEEAKRMCDF